MVCGIIVKIVTENNNKSILRKSYFKPTFMNEVQFAAYVPIHRNNDESKLNNFSKYTFYLANDINNEELTFKFAKIYVNVKRWSVYSIVIK